MKIVINSLERIAGVEIYPIISLIIFFAFFTLVTYLVLRTSKEEIEEMSHLPLDDNDFHQSDKQSSKN
ncbi:MAG: CcoQ/FixQ family Cbb3-type cytochrome c oxidase assembly chaperone [Bacteroidetes bacterium]|jgi:cbb3-type cytochrome oxidase subunit 3|nr:CcoQ/FixQ family Cbb3-type cytochrome c oxidase assembly chaperone [Bacteroidota bacterium]